MSIQVLEVDASAAAPVVDSAVVEAPGSTTKGEPSLLDSTKDRVEFGVGHVKGVVVAVKAGVAALDKRDCTVVYSREVRKKRRYVMMRLRWPLEKMYPCRRCSLARPT
jgi:hypothetical protein